MFLVDENKRKIRGACRSFVLGLECVAICPFVYFDWLKLSLEVHNSTVPFTGDFTVGKVIELSNLF